MHSINLTGETNPTFTFVKNPFCSKWCAAVAGPNSVAKLHIQRCCWLAISSWFSIQSFTHTWIMGLMVGTNSCSIITNRLDYNTLFLRVIVSLIIQLRSTIATTTATTIPRYNQWAYRGFFQTAPKKDANANLIWARANCAPGLPLALPLLARQKRTHMY